MKKHHPTSRHLLSAVTLGICTLSTQLHAQQAEGLQRVEITGSSISRVAAENALPVTVMKAEEFTQRGITSVADIMMTLPQSLSLAPSNAGAGTNINLRGLGVNRTLVLLNGHRLANEPTQDGFVNLDIIPMSALERVEVLNDGASSIYGSDAIAGVINFITKRSYTGAEISVQSGQPQRHGGGDEQRFSVTGGVGNLDKDGWNAFATMDYHHRSRLAQSDRAFLSDAAALTALGRPPTASTGTYTFPANVLSGKTQVPNPYFATGCQEPYSYASTNGSKTCVLDANTYATALYENEQQTFYAKGTKKFSEDHSLTLEYVRGQEHIVSVRNPVTSAAISYSAANLGSPASVTAPIITPASSKWYPGGAGGVPAIFGSNGAKITGPLTVEYSGPLLAGTKDQQINQRTTLSDKGVLGDWEYKVGVNYGSSDRSVTAGPGIYDAQKLNAGIANGTINPFGAQDTAGQAYLDSISLTGAKLRTSTATFAGVDAAVNRELMKLDGGSMAIALGADWHKDTDRDQKLPAGLYAAPVAAAATFASSQRKVGAVFAELEMPLTKQLTINAAIRDDHYSDVGNTINPKASFRFQPTPSLMFRGAASTGFRAPTLSDLYGYTVPGANTTSSQAMDDPVLCPSSTPSISGTGKAIAGTVASQVCNVKQPVRTGANPNLTPEKSKTFTLGTVLEPVKNASLSLDYWHVEMTDMIGALPQQAIYSDPIKYLSLFVRNADGSLAYINNTTTNLGGQRVSGIDLSGSYQFPKTDWGTFKLGLDGTYLTQFDNQVDKGGAWVSNVGRFGLAGNGTVSSFPIISYRWRHNLRLQWTMGDWSSQVTELFNTHYLDQNTTPTPAANNHYIPAYSLVNWMVSYNGIKNLKVVAGINNLFDRMPPATNNASYSFGYVSSTASPLGREAVLTLTYKF